MGFPGPMELIIVFAIILLLFGANKMPQMARSLGKGIREFKKAQNELSSGLEEDVTNPSPPEANIENSKQKEKKEEEEPSTTSSSESDKIADN